MIDLSEVDSLVQRAVFLTATGSRDEAEALLRQATALAPDDPMAQTRLAEIENDRKLHHAATTRLRSVLRRAPNFAPAWAALAHASWIGGHPAEGLRHARRALDIAPQNPRFRLVMAQFCVWLYRHQEVADTLAPLLTSDQPDPMTRAGALSMTGEMLMAAGHLAQADEWFEAALRIVPDLAGTRVIMAMNRLRQGDFAEGWAGYEDRVHVSSFHPGGPPKRPAPAWAGQDLHGRTILLEDDQGFGDSIHFFRYVWSLRDAGAARIVLRTFKPLLSLFRAAAPFVEVTEAIPEGLTPDFHCLTTSLAHGFGTTLTTMPATAPYLFAPTTAERRHLCLDPDHRPRVGLVWSGDPRHLRDHLRSIPAARFLTLADREDCTFVSLQREVRPTDLPALTGRPDILRTVERAQDYADTAALIAQLDLVIAVDTSVAHLAGALGKPVWLLLPQAADWRWLTERTDSPWYPTMRLFRADRRGWLPLLRRVAAALDELCTDART